MRNNLACLGGYPTHGDVADIRQISFIFILRFMIKGDDARTEISPFEAK